MKPYYKLIAAITLVGVLTLISMSVSIQRNQAKSQLQQAQPLLVRSTQLIQKGQYSQARTTLEQALQIIPNQAIVHNNLGFVCQQIQDSECAKTHSTKAVELRPRNWRFRKNLASYYESQHQYAKAKIEYLKTLELAPIEKRSEVTAEYSRLLNRIGNYTAGLKQARSALSHMNPPEIQAVLETNIAWAYWKTGQLEKAQSTIRDSIQTYPLLDNLCLANQIKATQNRDRELKQCQAKIKSELSKRPQILKIRPEIQEWSQPTRS